MRLQGKRPVVTGAASGIGKATTTRFSTEGAVVVIADVDGDAGMVAAKSIRAFSATEETNRRKRIR